VARGLRLKYRTAEVTTVSNEYRTEPAGGAFIVIDPWGEPLVGVFSTEDAAKQDIERCKREDAMYQTAKQLVDTAVKAHMEKFGVDVRLRNTGFAAQRVGDSRSRERQMSDEKESLIGRRVRFRADFYTTRIMPPRGWTGTIEDERRSSSGQGVTSYVVLLDEPFRLQEQDRRVDATEDEMEPF
jgi:hypothetical protein